MQQSEYHQITKLFYRLTALVKQYLYNPAKYASFEPDISRTKIALAGHRQRVFIKDIEPNEPSASSRVNFSLKSEDTQDQGCRELAIAVPHQPETEIRDLLARVGIETHPIPVDDWDKKWLEENNMQWPE